MRLARTGTLVLGLAVGVFAAGCDDDNPVRPSDPLVVEFSGTSAAGAFPSHTVTSDRRGIATARVTWGSAAIDLDLIATDTDCTFNPQFCSWRAGSTAVNTTSETIRFGMAPGETLKLYVQNFSAAGTSYALTVTIE